MFKPDKLFLVVVKSDYHRDRLRTLLYELLGYVYKRIKGTFSRSVVLVKFEPFCSEASPHERKGRLRKENQVYAHYAAEEKRRLALHTVEESQRKVGQTDSRHEPVFGTETKIC